MEDLKLTLLSSNLLFPETKVISDDPILCIEQDILDFNKIYQIVENDILLTVTVSDLKNIY